MNDSAQPPDDTWLLPSAPEVEQPAAAPARRTRSVRRLAVPAALLVAGLVAGVAGSWAVQGHDGSGLVRTAADAGSGDRDGRFGGQAGGVSGEQRLTGTLTAVGASSITVRTASGTATYTVTAVTDVERNGTRVALSALRIGDPVLVHLVPSGSGTVVERVLDGTLPAFGDGPQGAPGTQDG